MVKGAERVDILAPGTSINPYTELASADWTLTPTVVAAGVTANVQPATSTEAQVTAGTLITRWVCHLPGDLVGVTAACRIRWRGDMYTIEGDVEQWRSGRRTRRLAVTLKRVREQVASP